jgi:hypothetical protein
MLQPIFDWIEKFATDFTWKRLVIFLSFLALLGGSLAIYEQLTGTFELRKYEKAVGLLERLQSVQPGDPSAERVKANIYQGLVSLTSKPEQTGSIEISFGGPLKQAIAAGAIWFVIAMFFLPGMFRGDVESRNALIGLTAFGTLVGFGGYMLPQSLPDWALYGLYPVGLNLLLVLLLAFIGNRTK